MFRRRTRFVALILSLASLPVLGGCATLGIATNEEMTQLETDLKRQDRQAATRIQALEEEVAQLDAMQEKLTESEATLARLSEFEQETTADVDSLMTEFREARAELEAMGLSTMAEDLATARSNSKYVADSYMALLRTQYEALGAQIEKLESLMQARTSEPSDPPGGMFADEDELLPDG